ncbi:MAG TPA: hypothetical protein VLC49_13700 [Solirubrobacteraceae bacterium]|nr:hypothetical protein [Solirubrobacteraceae bacterium]
MRPNTPIRDWRPALQATLLVGPPTDARPRTLLQALLLAGALFAAATATGSTAKDASTVATTIKVRRPGDIAGANVSSLCERVDSGMLHAV